MRTALSSFAIALAATLLLVACGQPANPTAPDASCSGAGCASADAAAMADGFDQHRRCRGRTRQGRRGESG
ncbi:MAG: hypothetical protein QM765_22515 [Myxococcales bacterium]